MPRAFSCIFGAMFDYQPVDPQGLLTLFTFDNKKALKRFAERLVIHQADFVALILEASSGTFPLRYRAHHSQREPKHLHPTEEDRQALGENGIGPLKPAARKTLNKFVQMLRDRQHLSGHMFYTGNLHEWHFICFDQRDLAENLDRNHWTGGSHVHFINWLWPNIDPHEMWRRFVEDGEKPNSTLHIRHDSGASRFATTPPTEQMPSSLPRAANETQS